VLCRRSLTGGETPAVNERPRVPKHLRGGGCGWPMIVVLETIRTWRPSIAQSVSSRRRRTGRSVCEPQRGVSPHPHRPAALVHEGHGEDDVERSR
jgi:hypothetical protein